MGISLLLLSSLPLFAECRSRIRSAAAEEAQSTDASDYGSDYGSDQWADLTDTSMPLDVSSNLPPDSPATKLIEHLAETFEQIGSSSQDDIDTMNEVFEICKNYNTPVERRILE